jgi:CRISPR-associated helicase Cas3/CRISPR-associated endonuclease Cas3-HD
MAALAKVKKGGITRGLTGHSLDVAYCALAMLHSGRTRECLSKVAGFRLTDAHLLRLAILIALHDFGKANNYFQNKLLRIKSGSKVAGSGGPEAGHLSEALAALAWHNEIKALFAPLHDWCIDYKEMYYAIIGHHGVPVSRTDIRAVRAILPQLWSPVNGYDPVKEVEDLINFAMATFPKGMPKRRVRRFPKKTEFWHEVAGLTQVADWMASDWDFFPVAQTPLNREDRAHKLLSQTMWTVCTEGGDGDVLRGNIPRPLQQALTTLPLDQLVTLEAPTGEGKTEAAEVWGARLMKAGLVDGMYFAVPTRSAGTELHDRIVRDMTHAFPRLAGHVTRAVSGELGTDRRDPELGPTWALGSPKKTMGAPVAVGTVDQAMLSMLKNPHAWIRAWCLMRKLLVIDEAHASDPYMAHIITTLVKWHGRCGGYVLLMSATLGESLAHQLTGRTMLYHPQAVARPYPLITPSKGTPVHVNVTAPKTVLFSIMKYGDCVNPDRGVKALVELKKKTVLWVRSTVREALADVDVFRQLGLDTILHHSLFAAPDRKHLDEEVKKVIGKKGKRRPMVIVATQTCEQSLDIDADILFTDAVPADVMFQRMGRTGRHRVKHRVFKRRVYKLVLKPYKAPVVIIDPRFTNRGTFVQWEIYTEATSPEGKKGIAGQFWAFVYNPLPVRATIEWLERQPRNWLGQMAITVPTHSRAWVEAATHYDELLVAAKRYDADLLTRRNPQRPCWENLWMTNFNIDDLKRQKADVSTIERNLSYSHTVIDKRVPTRLGDPTIEVEVSGLRSPYTGVKIDILPVPYRWFLKVTPNMQPGVSAKVVGKAGADDHIEITDGTEIMDVIYGRDGLRLL